MFFQRLFELIPPDVREDQINTSILRSMLELVMEYRNYLKTI